MSDAVWNFARPWRIRYWKRALLLPVAIVVLGVLLWKMVTLVNWNRHYQVGEEIDQFNGVAVYYNGGVAHTDGRNLAPDGYNLGIKYQCVEFVKRYYYEQLGHSMPDSYGHAKHFFNSALADGSLNEQRNLLQFTNSSQSKPKEEDLLVFGPSSLNRYGHVAIVSKVTATSAQIVQQNPGPFGSSRETILLQSQDGRWRLMNDRVLGWLRQADADVSPAAKPVE